MPCDHVHENGTIDQKPHEYLHTEKKNVPFYKNELSIQGSETVTQQIHKSRSETKVITKVYMVFILKYTYPRRTSYSIHET